jgi:integrase
VRTFGLQYRKDGKTCRVKIGQWPAYTVEEARVEASALRQEVDKGGHPGYRIRTERKRSTVSTMEEVSKRFVEEKFGPVETRTTHGKEVARIFAKYVNPSFGDFQLVDVKRADLKPLIDKIAKKHGGSMAKHVLKRLRSFYKWAIGEDLVVNDPTYAIEMPNGEQIGSRVLEDHELTAVLRAIDKMAYPRRDYLKLVLLCGQRRKETSTLKVSDIDRANRVWKLGKTKTGAYQEVPFSDAAWKVVEPLIEAAEKAGRQHLFVHEGHEDTYLQNYSGVLKELVEAIEGEPLASFSLHDMRRTMRTAMPRLGVSKDIAELCLNHSKKGGRGGIRPPQLPRGKEGGVPSLGAPSGPAEKQLAIDSMTAHGGPVH